jgi:hypothetical protein
MKPQKQVLKTSKYGIIWENGVPRAIQEQPHFSKENASALLADLSVLNLNSPYDGDDEKYFGITKGEAIAAQFIGAAADGDKAAIKEVMDRIMGKPQQNIKSVTVKGTLADFLDTLDTSDADVIDI